MLERCCAAAASLGRVYSTDGSAGFGLSATVSTICKAADIWTAARPPAGGQRLGGLWLKVCCPAAARIGRRRGKGGLRQAALVADMTVPNRTDSDADYAFLNPAPAVRKEGSCRLILACTTPPFPSSSLRSPSPRVYKLRLAF